jgi:hypothetical protein
MREIAVCPLLNPTSPRCRNDEFDACAAARMIDTFMSQVHAFRNYLRPDFRRSRGFALSGIGVRNSPFVAFLFPIPMAAW